MDDFRPTFLTNAYQTRVRVGVHLLALDYKHFSDSLWNRRKPIIWEIVEDSKKRRQMFTLRKVWPSREQVGREFTSSPHTFPFGNNCADDCDSDDFVISVGCNMLRITKSLTSSVEQHWVWEEYWDLYATLRIALSGAKIVNLIVIKLFLQNIISIMIMTYLITCIIKIILTTCTRGRKSFWRIEDNPRWPELNVNDDDWS